MRLVDAVLIDGRSGSGKTEYAARLAAGLGARVIHLDDLYPGWHGLAAASQTVVDDILTPLAQGRPAQWRCWDWYADDWDLTGTAQPGESLVIEGCGSLTPGSRALAREAIWLQAAEPVRRARALDRDGDDSWWTMWRAQEDEHLARHRPQLLADRVIDTGPTAPPQHYGSQ